MQRKRITKRVWIVLALLLTAVTLSACSTGDSDQTADDGAAVYHKISAKDAKAAMDSEENIVILDVREQYEFDAGHIPDATLLPLGDISAKAAQILPDKDQKILVYCRSGSRARTAANTLVRMGYTQIYDLGGIINWPYDVVK